MPARRLTDAEQKRLKAAERKRRSRAHQRGDHSLCDPARCTARPPAAPTVPAPEPMPTEGLEAETFGPRGQRLWADMRGAQMGPGHKELLVEACRLTDRLDRLHRLLDGGDWFEEREDMERPYRAEIVVDRVLSEARQHTLALKTVVAELEARPKAVVAPTQSKGAGLADLTARIAARRGQIPAG